MMVTTLTLMGGLLFFAQPSEAPATDLKIVQTYSQEIPHVAAQPASRSYINGVTMYIHGPRFRREPLDPYIRSSASGATSASEQSSHIAVLYQCDLKRVVDLDLDTKLYSAVELDQNGFYPGTSSINSQGVEAMLKKRAAEQAEGTVKKPGSPTRARESESNGWYIDLKVPYQCPTAVDAVYAKYNVRFNSFLVLSGQHEVYDLEEHGQREDGFPIEVTTRSSQLLPDGRKMVDVSRQSAVISRDPLDPALFEIPGDFAKGARSRITGKMRPDTFYNDVQDWCVNAMDYLRNLRIW